MLVHELALFVCFSVLQSQQNLQQIALLNRFIHNWYYLAKHVHHKWLINILKFNMLEGEKKSNYTNSGSNKYFILLMLWCSLTVSHTNQNFYFLLIQLLLLLASFTVILHEAASWHLPCFLFIFSQSTRLGWHSLWTMFKSMNYVWFL